MTLEENFIKKSIEKAKEIECKQKDDYAIEFIEWCFDNEYPKNYWTKALTEFKKEKGYE